jgi:hypothetical protein
VKKKLLSDYGKSRYPLTESNFRGDILENVLSQWMKHHVSAGIRGNMSPTFVSKWILETREY